MEFIQEDCDYNISKTAHYSLPWELKMGILTKTICLSGGEIIKLMLAKKLMGSYNILLMDEPSNFLDIPSLEALEVLMKGYAGTIIILFLVLINCKWTNKRDYSF